MKHSLENRRWNEKEDFIPSFVFYSFVKTDFKTASRNVAHKISSKYGKINLALSGGTDSLFILNLFHKMKLDFTPIIGVTPANGFECSNAFQECQNLGIVPQVNFHSEDECFSYFKEKVFGVCKSVGYKAAPRLIAAEQSFEKGVPIIFGDNCFGQNSSIFLVEWDFYLDIIFGKNNSLHIPFFLYDLPIFDNCIDVISNEEISYNITRAKLFGTNAQLKYDYKFSDIYMSKINSLCYFLPKNVIRTFTCNKENIQSKLREFSNE